MHRLLRRQLKRSLDIDGEEDLAGVRQLFSELVEAGNLPMEAHRILNGFEDLLQRVDAAYAQHDRDMELRNRSLNLSSDELTRANDRLRAEAGHQAEIVESLRATANQLLHAAGKEELAADENSLEKLSRLMAELVGEKQKAQRELEQQKFALDQHAIVSMTDTDGAIIYANDRFCEISGYRREELMGVNHRIVASGQHSPEFFRDMWRTIGAGRVWHGEIHNRAKDGGDYWVAATIVPILDEQGRPERHIAIRTDITRLKRLEAAIKENQRFLQSLTDSMGEGVYALDDQGRCAFLNPEAVRILGWIQEELAEQNFHDTIHYRTAAGTPLPASECRISKAVRRGEVYRSEDEVFISRDGTVVPVSVIAMPMRDEGEIIGQVAVFQDITERRRIQETLRKSQEQLQIALEASQTGLWDWNPQTDAAYFSDQWLAMLGYGPNELSQTWITWISLLHPEDQVRAIDTLHRHLRGELPLFEAEFRMRHRDGSWKWILSAGQVSGRDADGEAIRVTGIHKDVSERKHIEDKLQAVSTRLSTILENLQNGVLVEDENRHIVLVNRKFHEFFHVSPEDPIALPGADRLALAETTKKLFSDPEGFAEGVREAVAKGEIVTGEEMRLADNRFFERDYIPIVSDGEIRGHLWQYRDVSQRKEVEREINQAKEQAEAANRAKSNFLANMSHEIRTPMNAIIGLSHLALQTDLNTRQRGYLDKIQGSAKNLLGIINDILDFSKIEAGRMTIERNEFPLDEVLDQVAAVISLPAASKGLEFVISEQPGLPQRLVGDPMRLGQILTNLASNAVKFTQQGEVVVRVEAGERRGDLLNLCFSVRDTGIGLSEDQMRRLFQSFSQADASTTRKYGGTGLGLAICRRLVELMGGEIGVESQPGAGSLFHFTLPFGVAGPLAEGSGDTRRFRGQRALVVDDHATARDVLRAITQSFGLQVEEATSGEACLDQLRRAEAAGNPFHFVFLDWQMEGMDGLTAHAHIRRAPDIAHKPAVVLVTAYGQDAALLEANARDLVVVQKPVSPSSILDGMLAALGKWRPPHARLGHTPMRDVDAIQGILGARVLLAEDNVINQQVAGELLEGFGLAVACAEDGLQALDILAGQDFDLVLMDVQMPGLDGYETSRRIRADGRHVGLPIIALTAHAMAGDRDLCLASGMDDYLAKPIDPDELFAMLVKWIRPGHRATGPRTDKTPGKTAELPPALPGIDRERALANLMGDEALYRSILARFLDDYTGLGGRLREALAKSPEDATRMAHSIKGVAGTIGAFGLADRAMAIEHGLRRGVPPGEEQLATLEAELALVLSGLAATLAKPAAVPEEPFDRAAAAELLAKLKPLVATGDLESLDAVARLARLFAPTPLGALAQRLEKLANDFNFEEAEATLAELAARAEEIIS